MTGPPGPCGCGCALTPATSLGFSAVDFARDVVGIEVLPWQRWLLIHALELKPDGGYVGFQLPTYTRRQFRYRTVLILVARQNGKTTLVEVKNLWKMFVLRVPLVIGTAQNLDLSEESWDKAVEIAESIPELAAEVAHVDKTNGKKALKLTHGSRWKVAAASRKGGRGFPADDVNLDELREHQNWDSWGAVTKTTMARPNAQVWAFSNAGDDKSVVLNDLQGKARAAAKQLVEFLAQMVVAEAESIARAAAERGIDTSLGLFEWSAPDDVKCTCDREEGEPHEASCRLQDRRLWAMANPSLGYGTITEEALASALATDPEPIFLTECLCQRVPSLTDERVIPEELWLDLIDPKRLRPDDRAFAVQVNHRRTHTAIMAVGPRPDGTMLASVVEYRRGTDWVVERMAQLKEKWNPVAIAVQDKGPTASLRLDMEKAGMTPPEDPDEPKRGDLAIPWASDVAAAYGMFVDACHQKRLFHLDEAPLNVAVATTDTRPLGSGTAWDYRCDEAAPVIGTTLALWAYLTRVDAVTQTYDAINNIW